MIKRTISCCKSPRAFWCSPCPSRVVSLAAEGIMAQAVEHTHLKRCRSDITTRASSERLSSAASRLLFAQPRVWVIELLITLCSLRLLSWLLFARRPLKRSFAAAAAGVYMEAVAAAAWVSGEPYHRLHHHYSIVCTCTPPCWMDAPRTFSGVCTHSRGVAQLSGCAQGGQRRETRPRPLCFNEVVKEGAEKGARPCDGWCLFLWKWNQLSHHLPGYALHVDELLRKGKGENFIRQGVFANCIFFSEGISFC